jgi:ABC-type phosphate transport system substrate-binding protein
MSALQRNRLRLLALPGALLLGGSRAFAAESPPDFRVIVHASRPEQALSREFLANAFLKNVTRWSDDHALHPVDQKGDTHARRRFSESVLKRSVQAIKTYWQQRIFSGRGVPPPELDSDEAVVRWVESRPGAVGYVSGGAALGKTKAIAVKH